MRMSGHTTTTRHLHKQGSQPSDTNRTSHVFSEVQKLSSTKLFHSIRFFCHTSTSRIPWSKVTCSHGRSKKTYDGVPTIPIFIRGLHTQSGLCTAEDMKRVGMQPYAKNLQEEVQIEMAKPKGRKSLKTKVVDGLSHYYHGFRLLIFDVIVAVKLLVWLCRGNKLTRRERKQVRLFFKICKKITYIM